MALRQRRRAPSDEREWREFVAWCRKRGLRPLPAHPWTVAAYARWCERRHRHISILGRIRSIARAHLLACLPSPDRHPTVTQTLRVLASRDGARARSAALFVFDRPAERADRCPPAPAPATAPAAPRRRGARPLRSTPRLATRRPPGF